VTAAFARRVKALERALASRGGCHVISYGVNETPPDALARARAAGLKGGFLLLPEVMTPEYWIPIAREQQAELLRESLKESRKGKMPHFSRA
jgi:hypothetical protein